MRKESLGPPKSLQAHKEMADQMTLVLVLLPVFSGTAERPMRHRHRSYDLTALAFDPSDGRLVQTLPFLYRAALSRSTPADVTRPEKSKS